MILFFYGPNHFEMRQELLRMEEGYIRKTGSDFGIERVDGSKVPPRDLGGLLQAAPFLATSRLVVVDGLGAQKPDGSALEKVLEGIPDTTVAIFIDREVDKRTAYFKTMSAKARTVEFAQTTGPKLLGWVEKEVARLGGSIGRRETAKLIERAGEDQWRLSGEISKLVSYAPQITSEAIDELVAPELSVTIFDLVDAMVAGKTPEALRRYRELLSLRTNELYILTMVQWQLRNLLLAKAGGQMGQADLAKAAGMSPFVAGKSQTRVRSMSQEALEGAFLLSVACEEAVKTGREKGDAAVERLIMDVAALVSGKP